MKYQTILEDNKVRCNVCPRYCILGLGQKGFCNVRKNVEGQVISTAYGHPAALAIDPIEKKPLYHFYPATNTLSFGTLGCNMGCMFCQNWHLSKSGANPYEAPRVSPKDIVRSAKEYGCKSIAFTYNDPVVFIEYAIDTAKEAKKEGIKTVAVTAGYINKEPRKELFNYIDAVNVDLKGFSEKFYEKNCLAHISPILDTLQYIKNETNTWLEITTLLIEGENDTSDEIRNECKWIKENLGVDVPLHFSAFYPSYKFDTRDATKPDTLLRAYDIAKEESLNYVYTGNISNSVTTSTYCKNCKNLLIERNSYTVTRCSIENNCRCKFCGTTIDGCF